METQLKFQWNLEMVYRFFFKVELLTCIFKPHVKLETLQSNKMQKQLSNMSVHHVYMEKHNKSEMTQQHWLKVATLTEGSTIHFTQDFLRELLLLFL